MQLPGSFNEERFARVEDSSSSRADSSIQREPDQFVLTRDSNLISQA